MATLVEAARKRFAQRTPEERADFMRRGAIARERWRKARRLSVHVEAIHQAGGWTQAVEFLKSAGIELPVPPTETARLEEPVREQASV